ncbi:MAG: urease accessory protein UreD, partial [Bifidobacteriaceae bacterium]|nr:urease accessory protein UreD [Bifidobacteriaceae bacterium]
MPRVTAVRVWLEAGEARLQAATRVERQGDRAAPYAVRVLGQQGSRLTAAVVPTMATLLDGDAIGLEIEVGPGARLELQEVGATVAYSGRGAGARLDARLRVAAGACLVWAAHPLVLGSGAQVGRDLTVDLDEGGVALLRETIILGRSGEGTGGLAARTRVTGPTGPLLIEDLAIGDWHGLPGAIGHHRVVDSVLLLGVRPDPAVTP